MATTKLPTEASSSQRINNNKLDSDPYHWGVFAPSSPKMRQLLAEHKARLTQDQKLQIAITKT